MCIRDSLIIVPFIEWAMIGGLCAVLLSLVFSVVGKGLFILCSLTIGLVYFMARAMAMIPYGLLYLPSGGLLCGIVSVSYTHLEVWVVYADEKNQLNRLIQRNNWSKEEAKARINSQMSLKEKVKRASFVIDNNKDIDYTKKQVSNRWRYLRDGLKGND